MKAVCAIAAVALVFGSSVAWSSEAFRCDGHIISDGDSKIKLIEHCGQPTEKEGNKWIYDRGHQKFIIVVHFDDDVVSLIEEVPRD